jgi:hypothetical protein
MDELISVIVKEPGKKPKRRTVTNKLATFQKVVGGHIETVTLAENIVLVVNEDGIPLGLPYNCNMFGHTIYGTLMLVGTEGEDFCSLPYEIELSERGK